MLVDVVFLFVAMTRKHPRREMCIWVADPEFNLM